MPHRIGIARWSCLLVLVACRSGGGGTQAVPALPPDAAPAPVPVCEPAEAPELLPGVEPHHLTLSFWLEQLGREHDLDAPLLQPGDIAALNAGIALPRDGYFPPFDLAGPLDLDAFAKKIEERRTWARDKLGAGELVGDGGAPVSADRLAALEQTVPVTGAEPVLRVALGAVPIRCTPVPGPLYKAPVDERLDRNACSSLRPQEPVLVVAEWPGGLKVVQARQAFGWIAADAPLSPPVPEDMREAVTGGEWVRAREDLEVGEGEARTRIPAGTLLPAADGRRLRALVATPAGLITTSRTLSPRLDSTRRALTRRALLDEAFRHLGEPYGLGDAGGRDCSRFVLDVLEPFGIRLPRHSSWQARAGSFWIDVSKVTETERLLLIDAAAKRGIVLLSFPGHIMLYLGRDERGQPMAVHAFREYLDACSTGPGDRVVRVPGITVSTLELGRGTARTAFIERITHITVIGGTPGVELAGAAELRPAAEPVIPDDRACKNSRGVRVHVSPGQPTRDRTLRVLAALRDDPGPAAFTLIDPDGRRHTPETVRLGGPPHGLTTAIEAPRAGRWKAVLADGERIIACQRVYVRSRLPDDSVEPGNGPVWQPTREWSPAMEDLYALFIERLFDYPLDERVWPNLHTLLRDPVRNLFYDHFGLGEDEALVLTPDCADLPYTLRAYFAWKLRLPFGYRRCSRARDDRPPECDKLGSGDNVMSRLELEGKGGTMQPRGDVDAFSIFVNSHVRNAVHSSSGRTHPEDDLTDFYPVPLTRRALRPGTLFADPYGHLLIVADWVPQGAGRYGVLVGVDAQPDGTVGRRRFWRGSFLFDPDTTGGGAGFKAFRPRLFVPEPATVDLETEAGLVTVQRVGRTEEIINEDLRKTREHTRYSDQQYKRSADDFYASMEALINPRPLDPVSAQLALVDALEADVARRVASVDNGERFMATRGGVPIDMPEGASIFLTSGPWEDFSTPSRDLRLLVAIDSVLGFTRMVRAAPRRYGLGEDGLDQAIRAIEEARDRELSRRSITYTRSDGSTMSLTLAEIIARAERLEVAYNPNDCIEVRWGAAPGTPEMATCRRRAPGDQQARMAEVRRWFSTRKRPPQ